MSFFSVFVNIDFGRGGSFVVAYYAMDRDMFVSLSVVGWSRCDHALKAWAPSTFR
jgi:hypothetical protein